MNNKNYTEYTIQYWYDEEAREDGLSELIHETFEDKIVAIDTAEQIFRGEGYACVEVISNNDCEGDYGVVAHFEEAFSQVA
jgi:hypothetical protein